jgi:hypothetical protein
LALYAVLYFAGALVSLAPGYLEPHYSIRDTSRDLGKLLGNSPSVVVARAEGLFNGNTVLYRSFDRRTETEKPEVVVVGFALRGRQVKEWLDQNYHVAKTYSLYVSPEYARLQPDAENLVAEARVYEKNR